MKIKTLGAMLAMVIVFSLAQVAVAQGPPMGGGFGPRGHEGHGGPGGPGGFGGMMGGRGCVATSTAPCPAYQFTFTITNTEPVLVNGSASTTTKTTTGTIAGDANGSTYRDFKTSGMGDWASRGGPREFIFIKNLDPAVMMNYVVQVDRMTYEQFAIQPRTPHTPPNWQGKGPDGGRHGGDRPKPTVIKNYKISDSSYTCPTAEQTSFSHTVQLSGTSGTATVTTNRVYCTDLKIVVEEDHSDPRLGTSTYQLSAYMPAAHVSFTPPPGYKLVEHKKFERGGPRGGTNQAPAQP